MIDRRARRAAGSRVALLLIDVPQSADDLLMSLTESFRARGAVLGGFVDSPTDDEPQSEDELLALLSQREVEVLRLLATGKTNPEIADELFISRNTVQNHVSSILGKANLANRVQAAAYAQRIGLV